MASNRDSTSRALAQIASSTRGLKNIGNTCFLNAVLQAMASVRLVHTYLSNMCSTDKILDKTSTKERTPLSELLRDTIEDLCLSGGYSFTPHVTKDTDLKRRFLTREQQDAHELMQYVLSRVDDEEDAKDKSQRGFGILQHDVGSWSSLDPFTSRCLSVDNVENHNTTQNIKGNPFMGLMKSTLIVPCKKCGEVCSPTLQKFSTVSLSILTNQRSCSLEDTLEEFTIEEEIDKVECPDCYTKKSKLKEPNPYFKDLKYKARKRLTFAKAPKVLCLHLRRLVRGVMGPVKNSCHVQFPTKLDLAPYCSFAIGTSEDMKSTSVKPRVFSHDAERSVNQIVKRSIGASKQFMSTSGLGGGSNHLEAETSRRLEKDNHIEKNGNSERKQGSSSLLYNLVSVIVHHGSHLGGHYSVYRKLATLPLKDRQEYEKWLLKLKQNRRGYVDEDQWVFISDEKVQPCDLSEVLRSQAYMLYYEKC